MKQLMLFDAQPLALCDHIVLDGARKTADGYLTAFARIARPGIQEYLGREVDPEGVHFTADQVVKVYRPPEEVFSDEAMHSFAHRPLTMDHPSRGVTADNWKDVAIGQTGDEVHEEATAEGRFIRVPMVLMDGAAIKDVEAGKRELSCGYTTSIVFDAGTTPEGEAYDAKQTNIRGNHVAVVRRARGGPALKIGDDNQQGDRSMTERNASLVVDGVTVNVGDQRDAQLIDRHIKALETKAADSAKALEDAQKAHADAIAAKDKELGAKDAEIETLKASQFDAAKLDQMVADRAEVVTKAKALDQNIKTAGVKDADIRRAAVAAKLGDAKVKDKSDDYVGALFDHLTADVKVDPLAKVIGDGTQVTGDAAAKALADHNAAQADAWRGKAN